MRDNLFINIIESPSVEDLSVGRTEGKMLTAALDLIRLPYEYSLVKDYSEFMDALGRKGQEGIDRHKRVPAFHLSMHGNRDGIVLTDGKFLPWEDLNWKFRLINGKLQHSVVVCLSCCYGLNGLRMLRRETLKGDIKNNPPFRLLVSNVEAVPWSDAAVAFSTFYHLLEKGRDIFDIVKAMRTASGNDQFFGLLVGESDDDVFVLGTEELRKAAQIAA